MTLHQAWPRGGERKAVGQGREEAGILPWTPSKAATAGFQLLQSGDHAGLQDHLLGVKKVLGRWEDKDAHRIRRTTGPQDGWRDSLSSPVGWPIAGCKGRTASHYLALSSLVENEANALESGNCSLETGGAFPVFGACGSGAFLLTCHFCHEKTWRDGLLICWGAPKMIAIVRHGGWGERWFSPAWEALSVHPQPQAAFRRPPRAAVRGGGTQAPLSSAGNYKELVIWPLQQF